MHFGRRVWSGGAGEGVRCTRPHTARGMLIDSRLLQCLFRVSHNVCCAGKDPREGFHAQAHPYTPTGKGLILRGAFSSTSHTGTDTGSGGGFRTQSIDKYEIVKVTVAVVGTIAAVSGSIAYGVHHLDQKEIKRIEGERKTEVARIEGEWKTEVARIEGEWKSEVAHVQDKAETEIKRIEGERKLSELFWKAEVERYKRDLQLAHTFDYEPYQAAVSQKKGKKRGEIGGLEGEEKKD